MSDGVDGTTIAPAPTPSLDAIKEQPEAHGDDLVVAEVREDGVPIVKLPDGRMVPATLAKGVEVEKGDVVEISHDGEDESGAPKAAEITHAE